MFGLLAFSLVAFTSCKKNEVLEDTQIPEAIVSYARTNFLGNEISECKIEKDGFKKFYNVNLTSNGVNLRFTEVSEIKEIHSTNELPETVIQPAIFKYVDNNYSSNYITNWVQDSKKKMQTIRLNDGLRLEFDSQGDFQRVVE